jgi:hypothetical protein
VDVDAIGFDWEWTGRIVERIAALTGLPRQAIRFSCTHTHSGPNTFRLATIGEGRDMALDYLEGLPHRIAGAVWQAQLNPVPVRVAAGSGRCDINVNRRLRLSDGTVPVGRNWEGPVDHTVRVVRIDRLDETPVATIVHYSCHPTTMAWQTRHFTPDYPGAARQVVEREIGGTCLFLQGSPGDITPRRGFTGDLQVYRRLGATLGLEAARVATALETLPRHERIRGVQPSGAPIVLYDDEPGEPDTPALKIATRIVKLPAKQFPPPGLLEAQAAALREELDRLRQDGSEEEVRAATARATQAGWQADNARLYYGKEKIEWPLMGIRIGPIALVSVAGEPFTEIGQRIATASPFVHTLFSGYSNGGFGYIPTSGAYEQPSYEIAASPFAPGADNVLVEESLRMLRELAGEEEARTAAGCGTTR